MDGRGVSLGVLVCIVVRSGEEGGGGVVGCFTECLTQRLSFSGRGRGERL